MASISRFCPEERLDAELCTGCGICAEVCPSRVISLSGPAEGPPVFSLKGCIGCGSCAAHCPENAFGMERRVPEAPSDSAMMRLLRMRRSTRLYSKREPSMEELRSLCADVLARSPTGTNSCGLDVRLVGRSRLDGMVGSARRVAKALNALGLLRLIARTTGMGAAVARFLRGEDMVFHDAPAAAFIFVSRRSPTSREDGVIAGTLISLLARTRGMGSLWNGVAAWLYRLLGSWRLPRTRGRRLAAVLCLGYPAAMPLWEVDERPYGLELIGFDGRAGQPSGKASSRGTIR